MKQFFKFVLATIVGLGLFSLISILIVAGIGAAAGGKKEIKDKAVLRLSFKESVQEIGQDNPFAKFSGEEGSVLSLSEVKNAIAAAAKDDKVKGILLDPRFIRMGISTSDEIRRELIEFKKSKKFVKAYGDIMSEGSYYLASVADEIVLSPEGDLEFNGLGTNNAFLKGMFTKLEIEPEIFKVGTYKSAVEPFIMEKMSEANREQTISFLTSINQNMLARMAESRKKTPAELKAVADSVPFLNGEAAVSAGLVDRVAYLDELENDLRKLTETDADEKINYVSLEEYIATMGKDEKEEKSTASSQVAVISAEGSISTGSSDDGITSDHLTKLIRKARLDDDVKAIVLRVNSPGGDALASDVIWREVVLTDKVKPVVVSMGDVAASGGYYISMGARKIYAEPTTITGSIGVFGVFFNAQDFWNNKAGITFDGVKTSPYADFPNATRPFTPQERQFLQRFVAKTYNSFTTKAAQGRKMDVERLRSLAEGRVWTGEQAKANGLVDELGGLDVAIKSAASIAKLKEGDYEVKKLPGDKNFFEELMQEFTGTDDEANAATLVKILGPVQGKMAAQLIKAQQQTGIRAELSTEVSFR